MEYFGGMGRGLGNNRLDFSAGLPIRIPDYDRDPGFLKDSLFTVATPTDNQE